MSNTRPANPRRGLGPLVLALSGSSSKWSRCWPRRSMPKPANARAALGKAL